MRGGVECGRMPASARSAEIGEAIVRRGCGAAIGRDDEAIADGGPAEKSEYVCSVTG